MKQVKKMPSINIPIQKIDGSMEWVWYMFFQWLSEHLEEADLSNYFTKEETEELLSAKADIDDLSNVAFSGDYSDLSNKPTIPAAQVQSDWDQTDNTQVDYIKNKPTIPAAQVQSDWSQTDNTQVDYIKNKPTIPAAQIQSDWSQTNNTKVDYIKNKPTIPSAQVNSDWNATSGVAEILNKPTIPTVGNGTITLTQGGTTKGTFTTNQSGNTTIDFDATGSGGYHPDIFDWKWADHQVNDVQWLRADTFSWQDGDVYEAAYNHLADDVANGTIQNETIAGISISYYLAPDGHKITTPSLLNNVEQIYNATGVAWYYVWDNTNKRFKLPRTKFGVTGLRDTVGKYVAPGLPNITGSFGIYLRSDWQNGAFYQSSGNGYNTGGGVYGGASAIGFDASRSNALYGAATTVQSPATQMYLYFYVGEFTQTALENTAGVTTETLNSKADTDFGNVTSTGKARSVSWGIPDYASVIAADNVSGGTWIQCVYDSIVCVWAGDPYMEDYFVYVSPDKSAKYVVGRRYDDTNAQTQSISFYFFVPKGWWFRNNAEQAGSYRIYPLKGAV